MYLDARRVELKSTEGEVREGESNELGFETLLENQVFSTVFFDGKCRQNLPRIFNVFSTENEKIVFLN